MTGKPPWQPQPESFESIEDDRTDLPPASTVILVTLLGTVILALLFLGVVLMVR
jgi:hypothetical protein